MTKKLMGVSGIRKVTKHQLDYYPTPSWATRALCETKEVKSRLKGATVWEPAAGGGDMVKILLEYTDNVLATDINDYGQNYQLVDFPMEGKNTFPNKDIDFIITNPPFNQAEHFVHTALDITGNVAMLCRVQWLEGQDRYTNLFAKKPFSKMLVFCERVSMEKGVSNTTKGSAMAFCWFIWLNLWNTAPQIEWVPPGSKQTYSQMDQKTLFS